MRLSVCEYSCSERPEKSVESPGAGVQVVVSCPRWSQTWVLYKSGTQYQSLRNLSSSRSLKYGKFSYKNMCYYKHGFRPVS